MSFDFCTLTMISPYCVLCKTLTGKIFASVQTANYPQCLRVPVLDEMALFLISILWALLMVFPVVFRVTICAF